jgi:hypothetical protein
MSATPPFDPLNTTSHRMERGLFERSTAARTFGSLGIFLVLIFLGAGIYLLQQAFTDPLAAQAAGVLAGAFILTLAIVMIGLLFTPRKKSLVTNTRRNRDAQGQLAITARPPKSVPAQPELRRI